MVESGVRNGLFLKPSEFSYRNALKSNKLDREEITCLLQRQLLPSVRRQEKVKDILSQAVNIKT